MSKYEAEQYDSLSIYWLKKHGYLHKDYSLYCGSIKWSRGSGGNRNGINFAVKRDNWGTAKETTYIELTYSYVIRQSGEKEDINYRVQLETSPCNLGGKRYWFICHNCGKRVGVLYSIDRYFWCRHCCDLTYGSRNLGGYRKLLGRIISIPKIEKLESEVKRKYYGGQMTKKYIRFLKMKNKSHTQLVGMFGGLRERDN